MLPVLPADGPENPTNRSSIKAVSIPRGNCPRSSRNRSNLSGRNCTEGPPPVEAAFAEATVPEASLAGGIHQGNCVRSGGLEACSLERELKQPVSATGLDFCCALFFNVFACSAVQE